MADKPNYNKTRYEQYRMSLGFSDDGMAAIKTLSEEYGLSYGKLFEAIAMFADPAEVKHAVDQYREHFKVVRSKMKEDRKKALDALSELTPEQIAALVEQVGK
jgi:hypothetical protein